MLPNRMQLDRRTEEHLKKLKGFTGITPNITARIAFFKSINTDFRFSTDNIEKKLDGSLILDKYTWLGDTLQITELSLKMLYPDLDHKHLMKAWASHVEDGIASLRTHRNLLSFLKAL